MIDFHTHVLPGIDDGCKTTVESLQTLKIQFDNGVTTVVATPHYYRDRKSLDDFLSERQAAYEETVAAAETEKIEIPQILLGAEVAYFPGISRFGNIEKLCIGDTKYLLIEMPFKKWDSFVMDELEKLVATHGITPIIAHAERYPGYKKMIPELIKLQLPVQVNAASLLKFGSSRFLLSCIKDGYVQLIGSDCHNLTTRPPNLHIAMSKIEKKLGRHYVDKLEGLWSLMLKLHRTN